MKNDLTTRTWQDDIWYPTIIILFCTSDEPLQRESKETYKLSETHPRHEFSHLIKSKHKTVPWIALPTETVCPLKDLQLNTTKPIEESLEKGEIYANMALLMFYPFRSLADLTIERNYWKKISRITKTSWTQGHHILE